ncbi:hypothetical protein FBD94_14340 [Pedobacter hiemivivus]|uniref:Lipoprotein n=1 Tax=Pedobacter hiemivivus TaxID=2530454 RepID=A0A4U1GBJ4_9SPHI|nr:hypothetical protein [Pedobacter hiemivivus]TCC97906.1 hypothetical protein EZ444_08325 [Pedobacter hiemivivus]TKC60093.1 hypothetical protein FBD94_14340 [Pedobacter hiemivivus]
MKQIITYLLASVTLPVLFLMASCSKENVPYDTPFVHINFENKSLIEVLSNRKDTVDYMVYLSSELLFEPVDVQYEIKLGDGLQEGRDFVLLNKSTNLNFPQGIFERSVRIAWKDVPVDPAKDNRLTINLISNSKNFILGLPGPDQLQKQLIITKK